MYRYQQTTAAETADVSERLAHIPGPTYYSLLRSGTVLEQIAPTPAGPPLAGTRRDPGTNRSARSSLEQVTAL